MLRKLVFAAALSAAVLSAGVANAAIYDTGLDIHGNPTDGAVDAHWAVAQIGGSFRDNLGKLGPLTAFIATDPTPGTPFPFNYWSTPIGTSNWIVPTHSGPAVTLDPNKDGYYLYSQLFTVAPGTPISGKFLADNDVTNISLFDVKTFALTTIYNGAGEGNFVTPTSFSLGSLNSDPYILTFVVDNFAQNGGNPSGLDVSFSSAVPEPSTWAMMILGFLGLGFMGYRRKPEATLRIA